MNIKKKTAYSLIQASLVRNLTLTDHQKLQSDKQLKNKYLSLQNDLKRGISSPNGQTMDILL